MRQFLAKAIIIFLALLVASIQIAPSVNLDPAAPRLEWAACLMFVFAGWLTAILAFAALLRTAGPLVPAVCLLSGSGQACDPPISRECPSSCCLRC